MMTGYLIKMKGLKKRSRKIDHLGYQNQTGDLDYFEGEETE